MCARALSLPARPTPHHPNLEHYDNTVRGMPPVTATASTETATTTTTSTIPTICLCVFAAHRKALLYTYDRYASMRGVLLKLCCTDLAPSL